MGAIPGLRPPAGLGKFSIVGINHTIEIIGCDGLLRSCFFADDLGTEQVQRLRTAISEYEQDRWRLIAAKVGNGFSPAACRDKAREISDIEREPSPQQ